MKGRVHCSKCPASDVVERKDGQFIVPKGWRWSRPGSGALCPECCKTVCNTCHDLGEIHTRHPSDFSAEVYPCPVCRPDEYAKRESQNGEQDE